MDKEKLKKILDRHKLWLVGDGGECADLENADLKGVDLRYANLYKADLYGANLNGADLSYANLNEVDLYCANLSYANLYRTELKEVDLYSANLVGANLAGANLRGAYLIYADLNGANLAGANLRGANLKGANLKDVKYNETTAFFALQCPEEGSFIGWKKCEGGVIVKLLIPADAERSSGTSRKCRASKAVVLEVIGAEKGISTIDASFVYEVGKEVVPDSFDDDRWNECSHGINFFLTRKEAENY